MGKIRHIAIQVPDLEKAAAFYEGVFDLKRVNQVESPIGNAISLSDGVDESDAAAFPGRHQGRQRRAGLGRPASHRLHGRGRESDRRKDQEHGGEFFMQLPSYPGVDAEKKFKDLNGIVFDVSEHDWRQSKAS